ncbi:tRNA threonylcarbamoyladenosine biosynthesis protein TsaB [Flavobacteriaceae bacterium MAR_2010_188]|nr:tRNA threonylcarbamoyladenosine biosynthesis protein TsaB [Flavobacteriaceae bacterium MAR_2010_188]
MSVFILNIETTTTNCSVSISKDGILIGLKQDADSNYSHAESLHVFIESLLKECGVDKSSISAVAISEGPGSYTGLRIGTSSAKGICYALDIPLIATSTLRGLAMKVSQMDGIIIPMLDARRKEVYSGVFDGDMNSLREIQAQILDDQSFSEYLNSNKVYFIGNANKKASEIINHPNAHFLEPKLPSSKEMVDLSYRKFIAKDFVDVAYYEPLYLKEFKANH